MGIRLIFISWLVTVGDIMIIVFLFIVFMIIVFRVYYVSFLECRIRNIKRRMLELKEKKKRWINIENIFLLLYGY